MSDQPGHPEAPRWIDRLAGFVAQARPGGEGRPPLLATGASGTIAGGTTAQYIAPAATQLQTEKTSSLNDAVTAEGLLVTLLAIARTKATDLALDESTVRFMRATQCEEEAHFNNLVTAGATPLTARYTIADQIFANPTSFLTTWLNLEQIMVGMYMAAARQQATAREFDLVEMIYQIGVVEGQHQALLKQLSGDRLPADRAFPAWQYRDTAAAMRAITRLGFVDGKGTAYDYPGPGDRYCRGITGLVAETSSEQRGPDVTPVANPGATPVSD
jgi:hypothetical protein